MDEKCLSGIIAVLQRFGKRMAAGNSANVCSTKWQTCKKRWQDVAKVPTAGGMWINKKMADGHSKMILYLAESLELEQVCCGSPVWSLWYCPFYKLFFFPYMHALPCISVPAKCKNGCNLFLWPCCSLSRSFSQTPRAAVFSCYDCTLDTHTKITTIYVRDN